MAKELSGLRVAILVAEGFEEVELTEPRKALQEAGAQAQIVSPEEGKVQAFDHHDRANKYAVDVPLEEARSDNYDALLLPGGALNPDQLRSIPKAVDFVKSFVDAGKPVAAICHAPWTLIEADVVRGKTMTSWPSLQTDLRNAGATWVDESVVRDGMLVTSRKPDDLPAFNEQMLALFGEAVRAHAPAK